MVIQELPKEALSSKGRPRAGMVVEEVLVDERGNPDSSVLTEVQMRALSNYRKYHGNISAAAKAAEISRDTFYRWREENAVFKHLMERTKTETNDVVENKLWDLINKGNFAAIKYYLDNNHPLYAPKLQVSHSVLSSSWHQKLYGKEDKKPTPKQAVYLEKKLDNFE